MLCFRVWDCTAAKQFTLMRSQEIERRLRPAARGSMVVLQISGLYCFMGFHLGKAHACGYLHMIGVQGCRASMRQAFGQSLWLTAQDAF